MLAVLSPAKSLDFDNPPPLKKHTQPNLLDESEALINIAREFDVEGLKSLMKVSDNIAELNVDRFQEFTTPFTPVNAKQAIFAFTGDVYSGFDATSLNAKDMDFAQQHIRILSGLYGVLQPLDLMQPYRLEMGTKLENQRGKNLYEFWGDQISNQLKQDLEKHDEKVLVNLASNEYFKSVKSKAFDLPILHIDFKERRDDKYKIISFSAKKARGLMARFMVEERVDKPDGLKDFTIEDYRFNKDLSEDNHWIFTRNQPK